MNPTNDALMAELSKSELSTYNEVLNQKVIVDIGIILDITAEGRAHVLSNKFVGIQRVEYNDAEVIFPGNPSGVFMSSVSNSPCLIFIPRTTVPSIDDMKVRVGVTSFGIDGVKVMPITTGNGALMKASFDGAGNLNIENKTYSITYTKDSIDLIHGGIRTSIDKNDAYIIMRKTRNVGMYKKVINDDGITIHKENADKTCITDISLAEDGTLTIKRSNGQQDVVSITVDSNNNINIDAENINLNGTGKSLVTYAKLNSELTKIWNAIQGHTHAVSTEGTAAAQTGTAYASGDLSTISFDISDAEASSLKTDG